MTLQTGQEAMSHGYSALLRITPGHLGLTKSYMAVFLLTYMVEADEMCYHSAVSWISLTVFPGNASDRKSVV